MFSRKKVRLVVTCASCGIVSLLSATSEAGRSVRSDASDGAFEFLGGFWGSDRSEFAVPGLGVLTDFKLNLGNSGGARYYTVCMSEDGFLRLVSASAQCASTDYELPPTRPYIAVFATDLDAASSGALVVTRGFVDTRTPYRLPEAAPAMRFWWNGISVAGNGGIDTFDVQVVLIDRSKGTNNGNFDIEFNYGNGSGAVPPPTGNPNENGFQGFRFGPNSRGPTSGPFGPFDDSGTPIRFCFRAGERTSC
jgi:hypothetical protein